MSGLGAGATVVGGAGVGVVGCCEIFGAVALGLAGVLLAVVAAVTPLWCPSWLTYATARPTTSTAINNRGSQRRAVSRPCDGNTGAATTGAFATGGTTLGTSETGRAVGVVASEGATTGARTSEATTTAVSGALTTAGGILGVAATTGTATTGALTTGGTVTGVVTTGALTAGG